MGIFSKTSTVPTWAELRDRPHPENPREISAIAVDNMKASIDKYGDLSGIVFNARTKRILCGHQRVKQLGGPDQAETVIVEQMNATNDAGTIATGYILVYVTGERWPYRVVDVDENVEREMMVAANAHGGEWNIAALGAQLEHLKKTPALGVRDDLTRALKKLAKKETRPASSEGAIVESKKQMPESVRATVARVMGGRTAQARDEPSAPVSWYETEKLLREPVLDFGCGLDLHKYARYDPVHATDLAPLMTRYETVMCNYVLNVLPLVHQRAEVCLAIRALLPYCDYKGDAPYPAALFAVWGPGEEQFTGVGYQSGWERKQWHRFLENFFVVEELKGAPFRGWKCTVQP